jgi:hypothetical protein
VPGSGPGLQAIRWTVPAVTVRRAPTSAMAQASAAGTVRVRKQIIHSGAARPTALIGRAWRQIGGSARGYQGVGGPLNSPGTAY